MELGIRVLEYLSTYKFLSLNQFRMLWVIESNKTIYSVLKSLRSKERRMIWTIKFRYNPKYWRVEDIHYLKIKWKKYLINEMKYRDKKVKMPIWNTLFYKDYFHRKTCIDIHIFISRAIKLSKWNLLFYDQYFESIKLPHKKRRETSTKIEVWEKSIRADSIFWISNSDSKYLYALELHNWFRVLKICQQLENYVDVLASWSLSLKYQLPVVSRILVVFEKSSTLRSTIERLNQHPKFKNMKEYFLFTTIKWISESPIMNWVSISWKISPLLEI